MNDADCFEPPSRRRRRRQRRREAAAAPRDGRPAAGLGVLFALAARWLRRMALLRAAREAMATAEQRRDFVPSVRVATVRGERRRLVVSLPATTSAFAAANIFARASGYIDKR